MSRAAIDAAGGPDRPRRLARNELIGVHGRTTFTSPAPSHGGCPVRAPRHDKEPAWSQTGPFSPDPEAKIGANTGTIAPQRKARFCKLLILKEITLAERVGFVPDEPASLKGLGRIGTARNRQIL